jgi:hypothetical protein
MVQALGDTDEFHSAGIGPVSRPRVVMLLGGLRELTAITVEDGGRMSDITDVAVAPRSRCCCPKLGADHRGRACARFREHYYSEQKAACEANAEGSALEVYVLRPCP